MLKPHALLRAPLRPEAKLLFLTAWGSAADSSIVELAPRIRSWRWFIAVAELERATRVARDRFAALGIRPTPEATASQMDQLATIAAFRAEHLKARLRDTLEVFAREGIDVVLLKGAALATTLYPSFIERPMGDIDLLVAPETAERAHVAARAAGWSWDSDAFPRSRYAGHHHLPPMDDAAGTGVRLELHTGIAIEGHPFALTLADIGSRCGKVRVGATTTSVPSSEHLLLHEVVHFAWSHVLSFGAWRTMRDVQLLAQSSTLDWDLFVHEAKRHRAHTCAYWTLSLARLLSGADVPQNVLDRTRPRIGRLKQHLLERHFVYHLLPLEEEWPSQRLRRTLWEVAIQPDRHGHGPLRPWEFDERAPDGPQQAPTDQPRAQSPRVVERIGRLGVWARYVRALT